MAEKKFFNKDFGAPVATLATWNFGAGAGLSAMSPICNIVQGTTANDRLGNKIFVHSIEWMLQIGAVAAGMGTNGHYCDIIVYHDKECKGTLPSGTNIFWKDAVNMPRAIEYLPRFSVLRKQRHGQIATTANAGAVLTAGPKVTVRFKIFPKKVIDFTGNNGTIADLLKHNYGVAIAASDVGCCTFLCQSQVTFSDV